MRRRRQQSDTREGMPRGAGSGGCLRVGLPAEPQLEQAWRLANGVHPAHEGGDAARAPPRVDGGDLCSGKVAGALRRRRNEEPGADFRPECCLLEAKCCLGFESEVAFLASVSLQQISLIYAHARGDVFDGAVGFGYFEPEFALRTGC